MNTQTPKELQLKAVMKKSDCSCGRHFDRVPDNAKFLIDPELGGYYWNCECKSTLYSPCLIEVNHFQHGMCSSCGGTWNLGRATNYCPHCGKALA